MVQPFHSPPCPGLGSAGHALLQVLYAFQASPPCHGLLASLPECVRPVSSSRDFPWEASQRQKACSGAGVDITVSRKHSHPFSSLSLSHLWDKGTKIELPFRIQNPQLSPTRCSKGCIHRGHENCLFKHLLIQQTFTSTHYVSLLCTLGPWQLEKQWYAQEAESGEGIRHVRIATAAVQDTVGPRQEQPLNLVCAELVTARYWKALSKRDCPSWSLKNK